MRGMWAGSGGGGWKCCCVYADGAAGLGKGGELPLCLGLEMLPHGEVEYWERFRLWELQRLGRGSGR